MNKMWAGLPSVGDIKLTGEGRNTRRKTCSGATFSITNSNRNNLGSNLVLHYEQSTTNI